MSALDVRQISEGDLKKARFPNIRQEFRVFIEEKAFDRAVTRGDADTTREIGGVLVGELLRDDAGPFLRVDATIDALHAEEKGAELTFTHATWEHIHKEMDATYAGKKIVGWYHTHPGFGIFLSDRDQFIQSSFFNLPFQIALVYDPKSKEHGVFAWRDGQPVRYRRYWVGEREHTWDGARSAGSSGAKDDGTPKSTRGAAPSAQRRAEEAKQDEADQGGALDWKTIGSIALLALVVGGFGGFWYGTREARSAIQELPRELDRARAEAVRAAINDIDAQLVSVLRTTVGNEAVRKPLDQMLADLDEAERSITLEVGPGDPEHEAALAKLRSARERAQQIKNDRGDAQAALTELERASKQVALDPVEVSRDLGLMRSALGALYAELATEGAKAGDMRRAQRLLTAAASVDPGNRARYEQQLKALEGGGRPEEGGGAPQPSSSGPRRGRP
jgi:proteasome lid subunit RPN8/RPN11